jgi:hypothetical protein
VSLSRQLALATDDEFREAMAVFAGKALAKGGTRKNFIAKVRPILRAMHRGGMDKQRLSYLRRLARDEFKRLAALEAQNGNR